MFIGEAQPVGAWGNVICFHGEVKNRMIQVKVAIVDLDTRELFAISDVLRPSLMARLARMGVSVDVAHDASPVGRLPGKLWWFTESWDTVPTDEQPQLSVPFTFRVSPWLAEELPAAVVAAHEERLQGTTFDPIPKRSGSRDAYWESANGVLDAKDVAAYRNLAPGGVSLPEGWENEWELAVELSLPHAPSICALYLHDSYPQWWDALPLTPYMNRGTWLLGHSSSKPEWIRRDHSLESNRRLQCAVALIVSAVDNLKVLRKISREKIPCATCGREFERGQLQAGEIYQISSAQVCGRCRSVTWPFVERDLTPVQTEGILATLRWYVETAGRVITPDMLDQIDPPDDLSAEALFIIGRPLPDFVYSNWIEWLGRAGVLGEKAWRPSLGYISVAADGHMCRSFLERVIDDFFSANGIAHEPEPLYPYDPALNPNGLRADWQLADGTFVEAAGLLTKLEYAAKMERKELLATRHGIPLVVLQDSDLVDLGAIFSDQMS